MDFWPECQLRILSLVSLACKVFDVSLSNASLHGKETLIVLCRANITGDLSLHLLSKFRDPRRSHLLLSPGSYLCGILAFLLKSLKALLVIIFVLEQVIDSSLREND